MKNYLPKHATAPEACEWLATETGEPWTLARLLEQGLVPWVWLDYEPSRADIFGDRTEGYLAPMLFGGDTARLAAVGTDALLTMTKTPDGVHFRMTPGLSVSIDELRFLREDLMRLAGKLSEPAPHGTPAAREAVERSITKQQVIDAFEGLHFDDRAGWRNALSDVPRWIEPCRVTLGRKGDNSTSATWNPVLIAVALFDKGITVKQLDPVFLRSLQDWAGEWEEASAYYR